MKIKRDGWIYNIIKNEYLSNNWNFLWQDIDEGRDKIGILDVFFSLVGIPIRKLSKILSLRVED